MRDVIARRMVGPKNPIAFRMMINVTSSERATEDVAVVRYLWFRHSTHHQEFVDGYFEKGNVHNINIREQTKHLVDLWKPHNAAIAQAVRHGDLLWRVKAKNPEMNTVDHIEVWRNADTIDRYFRNTIELDSDEIWTNEQRTALSNGLAECGIMVYAVDGLPITQEDSRNAYMKFVDRYRTLDSCIVETQFR